MAFMKVIKNKAYFKRFQVKFARRREGKTDYRARKRLIAQDKNKYNSPRYRLVVRITNRDVITQIIYATIKGDIVIAAAYSHELPRYGISLGLTNYAAAYATGLLLSRRLLTKYKLADKYKGNTDINGQDYNVEEITDGPRPFVALLDVGLRRTTTGSKVFAALKGATDGGLYVPHSERRFVGYDDEGEKGNPELLRKYIFGGHVADYMKKLSEESPEAYNAKFSKYVKAGIKADSLEATWKKVHAAIRANPVASPKSTKTKPSTVPKRPARLNLAQRRERVKAKLADKAKKAEQES
jgi:large subunit ribosomal protein L5e